MGDAWHTLGNARKFQPILAQKRLGLNFYLWFLFSTTTHVLARRFYINILHLVHICWMFCYDYCTATIDQPKLESREGPIACGTHHTTVVRGRSCMRHQFPL